MATKTGKVVVCIEELPSLKSHDPLITWSSDLVFFIRFADVERKRLSYHRLLVLIEIDFS